MSLPVIHIPHHQIRRDAMPQVYDINSFLVWLKRKGIDHTVKHCNYAHLIPTQGEINLDAVFKLINVGLDTDKYPVLISNGFHIVDGHHRWFAARTMMQSVKCIVVNYGLNHLLSAMKHYDGAEYDSIQNERGIK